MGLVEGSYDQLTGGSAGVRDLLRLANCLDDPIEKSTIHRLVNVPFSRGFYGKGFWKGESCEQVGNILGGFCHPSEKNARQTGNIGVEMKKIGNHHLANL